jgi:hypothetical protein
VGQQLPRYEHQQKLRYATKTTLRTEPAGRGRERRLLSQAGPTYHQGPKDNTGRGPQDSGMEGGAANAAWLFTSVTTTRSDHQLRLRRLSRRKLLFFAVVSASMLLWRGRRFCTGLAVWHCAAGLLVRVGRQPADVSQT